MAVTTLRQMFHTEIDDFFYTKILFKKNIDWMNSFNVYGYRLKSTDIVATKELTSKASCSTGTCFIKKYMPPSSSLLQGKHLPFSPSPLHLNIFSLICDPFADPIISLHSRDISPEIFLFTTVTFKYTYRAPLRHIGQEYQRT
jgi:hypothetical protein